MTTYPDEQKARVIERMLPPHKIDVPALSRETGIPKDTLYTWRLQARRARGLVTETPVTSAKRWSASEKFAMVVESAALSEAERGEYCRKRGVYGEQLEAWRRACLKAITEPCRCCCFWPSWGFVGSKRSSSCAVRHRGSLASCWDWIACRRFAA